MLDILHKLKIFFCDDDVEKIYVRDSTVIRDNEIHRMYNEILYGMLALTHSIHTIKKQTLIRNSRQSRILLLKNLG